MASTIIIDNKRPANIYVGDGVTAGEPIFIPTTGGGGDGGSELVEGLFGLPESMPSIEVYTDDEVYADLEQIIPTMDSDISTEQAADISRTVRSIVGTETESIGNPQGGSLLEQFFGVAGYEFISEESVLQQMEEIMCSLDTDLTAEMADSITEETISLVET